MAQQLELFYRGQCSTHIADHRDSLTLASHPHFSKVLIAPRLFLADHSFLGIGAAELRFSGLPQKAARQSRLRPCDPILLQGHPVSSSFDPSGILKPILEDHVTVMTIV